MVRPLILRRTKSEVLAEITRLRRACCHPKLVVEDSDLPGSKLELFSKTTADLRDGEHRVLVFSQFVGHLQIIRERLQAMGVSYQYLDGSTPPKQRQTSVTAFQADEGDVFLISLKAGSKSRLLSCIAANAILPTAHLKAPMPAVG